MHTRMDEGHFYSPLCLCRVTQGQTRVISIVPLCLRQVTNIGQEYVKSGNIKTIYQIGLYAWKVHKRKL